MTSKISQKKFFLVKDSLKAFDGFKNKQKSVRCNVFLICKRMYILKVCSIHYTLKKHKIH